MSVIDLADCFFFCPFKLLYPPPILHEPHVLDYTVELGRKVKSFLFGFSADSFTCRTLVTIEARFSLNHGLSKRHSSDHITVMDCTVPYDDPHRALGCSVYMNDRLVQQIPTYTYLPCSS